MKRSQAYVSVLFQRLLQPIVSLCELLGPEGPGPNEVQASAHENGYAASLIVLVAIVLESAVNRTRYIRGEAGRAVPASTIRRLGATELANDVEEIFVVRDVIAHGHIWEASVRWSEQGMKLDRVERRASFGDKKFDRIVEPATRQTRRLHLDVFPTRIHRGTAIAALKKCAEVLRFLEGLDQRYVYLEPEYVTWESRDVPFYEWVDHL
jgi:hypothetical protein